MSMRAFSGAALLASRSLVIPTAPAVFAASATVPPTAKVRPHRVGDDPGLTPSDTPRQTRTATRVPVGDPTDAARRFLADRRSTYHIADTARDLGSASRATEQGVTTVRFAQRFHGLPVAGAQYVVRTKDLGSSNVVSGTSGQYFTDLKVDVSHPLGFKLARIAALRSLERTRWSRTPKVTDKGSAVVPLGAGVLTRHVVVTGYDLARRRPVRQELYIHAHTGKPVLSYNSIQFDAPVDTTGPSINGGSLPLKALQKTSGGYELRDRSRDMHASNGGEILTRDAKGGDVGLFIDSELPPRLLPASSATIPFPASANGANDAHWSAGQVYEYYKGLGRNSIDGHGGTINSVVGVTDFGQPFPNAFWNGTYMVYGTGGFGFKPFSSALDVVGHEMTHGVIQNTSNLMYVGQSGTINEAAADYMGNTIQNKVEHISPSSPLDGLLGEQLCKTSRPADCAARDMNTLATTDDFIGTPEDNGGVHLNSTIVSGSWWQIRHHLGADIADALVYKTITQYLTPLSQFIDARNATVSAAQDSGLSPAQVDVVRQAFTDHGIEDNWEQTRLGIDSHALHTLLGNPFVFPRVVGGSWLAADITSADDQFQSILTGPLAGPESATRLSPNDAAYYDNPDSDGTTAVWSRTRDTDGRTYVQSKNLGTGTVTNEDFIEAPFLWGVRVSGSTIAYSSVDLVRDGDTVTVLRPDGSARVIHPLRGRTLENVDVLVTSVVYAVESFNGKWIRIRSYDSVARTNTVLTTLTSKRRMVLADLTLTPHNVVFSLDRSYNTPEAGIMVMNRHGRHLRSLISERSRNAPQIPMLTATDEAVSYTDTDFASLNFDTRVKQIPTAGGAITLVSCSRGFKGAPNADTGKGVAWVDFSTGLPTIVNRTEPVGACG
ncbi:MAG: M4 family metallopeptidase [Marmoricola sp.]